MDTVELFVPTPRPHPNQLDTVELFVQIWMVDSLDRCVGGVAQWPTKHGTVVRGLQPMWNSARQLPGASYDAHMTLRIELWDAVSDSLLGVARAALSTLSSADKTVTLVKPELEDQTDWQHAASLAEEEPSPDGEAAAAAAATVAAAVATVKATRARDRSTSPTRRPLATGAAAAAAAAASRAEGPRSCVTLHLVKRATPVKQVFFVRHGESRWNEAQAKKRVDVMVSQVTPLAQPCS